VSAIIKKYVPQSKMEGAGVEVDRVFGYYQVPDFDPFLMLDYFESDNSDESPGFPWHPHKGIETITYMLRGRIKHQDSIGNSGIIGAGDVQWMTSGKGIYHQEMPQSEKGGYRGFQFWLNMPAHKKLSSPKYQGIKSSEIKSVQKEGAKVLLISGDYEGFTGPIDKTDLGVRMMHVKIQQGKKLSLDRAQNKKGFIFVFDGEGLANDEKIESLMSYTLKAGEIEFTSEKNTLEFIFAEGMPIDEPVAWYGPMVMNTNEEIQKALSDLREGTFV